MKSSISCVTTLMLAFVGIQAAPKETSPNPDLIATTLVGPVPGYTCKQNGSFPHPEKCEYFYDCYNGVAWLALCTEGHLFDVKYDGCNFPGSVDCGAREIPLRRSSQDPFDCPRPDGYFPDPDNCAAFYICANNVGYLHACPLDHLYDVRLARCDYPQLVDCGDRATNPDKENDSNSPDGRRNE